MSPVCGILRLYILLLIILGVHHAGSTQTVTSQQHESAVLSFHFSHVSGPGGLYISLLKMESIDGDTKRSVICAFERGVWVYPSDYYKNRIELIPDLSNGKLDLILKDVKKEDEGIYKCQAANKENQEDKEIRLSVTNPVKSLLILKAEGDSVTFQTYYSGPRDEVLWKIGPDKLVVLQRNESHYYRLSDRASASFYGGFLTIRDLVESDSGHYSGNILNEGKYHETKFILKVTPSKPKVHYKVTEDAVTLYCESSSKGVRYEWRNSRGDLMSSQAVYTASPETLRINDIVTCIVRNKESETSSFLIIGDPLYDLRRDNAESDAKKCNRVPLIIIITVILVLSLFVFFFIRSKRSSLRSWWIPQTQDYSETSHWITLCEKKSIRRKRKGSENTITTCDTEIKDFLENKDTERERNKYMSNEEYFIEESGGNENVFTSKSQKPTKNPRVFTGNPGQRRRCSS